MSLGHRTIASLALLAAACNGGGTPGPSTPATDGKPPSGIAVSISEPPARSAEITSTRQALSQVATLDADSFAAKYKITYGPALDYDPKSAVGLDTISASGLAPTAAELDALGQRGFVIASSHEFPTFAYGYASLYSEHLPLYVSADSILDAVHRSYDEILKQIELGVLQPELQTLLTHLRASLMQASSLDPGVRADIDFYLAVASDLLGGTMSGPVAGANDADIASFVNAATAASGAQSMTLFGVKRVIDLSQFTPRGHYAESMPLQQYFRAMVWLGRIDFRLVETQSDGSQVFYRRQFDAMLGLSSLFDADNLNRQEAIDKAIQAFVGESDNMVLGDVGRLLGDLDAPANAVSVGATDTQVAQTLLDGGYGAQRIASEIMVNATPDNSPLPLNRSFLLFGQRYTLDSHVFSNVVYDRIPALRMLPSPLDAAFAALNNDQAGAMLDSQLRQYQYAPNLASMRVLADAHGDSYWGENLYNLWLSSLRALAPNADTSNPGAAGTPAVTGTEPWQRRMLNSQLGSWAELRHDTILYVKQSYSAGTLCEFPDAYVEPYPDFFAALERFAEYAKANVVPIAQQTPGVASAISDYFDRLATVATTLRQMAESERTGTAFTADQMAFINQAVTIQRICGGASANGWYPTLVFGDSTTFKPTIADVHTAPTDAAGNTVGNVLHVGTGNVRLMLVTAKTCTGPRAYAGLAFSYYEKVTDHFERLTDDQWSTEFGDAKSPEDVPWMSDLLGR